MVAKAHAGFMTEQEFKNHTKQIALRVIELIQRLPNTQKSQIIGNQLLQSAASIGANYLAACRGRTTEELIQKLCAVEEESDKSLYWLEVMVDAKIIEADRLNLLIGDLNEILAMTSSSIMTLRRQNSRDGTNLRL